MKQVRQKSVLPVYAVALCWVLFSLSDARMYRLSDFLLIIACSILVYLIASKLFPGKTIEVPEEPEPEEKKEPDDPELAFIISESERAKAEMLRLRDSIPEARIKTKINEIVDISGRIIKSAVEDPTDRASVKRFLNYYMPTTIKLLNSYDRMYSQGIEGTNISGTMTRIDEALDKIIDSYRRQLDALFADEALDIETDIKVLDTMLAREGLKEREF